MNTLHLRRIATAGIAALTLLLGACGSGGYSRGIFQGYVVGKTESQIIEQVGKPSEIDRKNPESPVFVYRQKTFDPDNSNRVDPETFVYLRKNTKGETVAADVGFAG